MQILYNQFLQIIQNNSICFSHAFRTSLSNIETRIGNIEQTCKNLKRGIRKGRTNISNFEMRIRKDRTNPKIFALSFQSSESQSQFDFFSSSAPIPKPLKNNLIRVLVVLVMIDFRSLI